MDGSLGEDCPVLIVYNNYGRRILVPPDSEDLCS